MKALMTYGTVNEDTKHISSYNIEYKAKAADGKYYGIIRENSKYFVKVATPGKETVAESYQYIGGIQNKKNYEYNSYANALKQFELKLGSINEAYDENRRVNVEALDPYKKEDLVIEGTEKMKNELARQRQIMRNACVIMNEATEIGSTPFKTQPEAEHDNSGDKDYPFTKEGKPEADRGAIKFDGGDPEKHSATFGPDSNDIEDYDLDKGATPKVKDSVASENPSGGKVARVNESMEECGGACAAGPFNEEGEEDLELGQEEQPVDTEELDSVAPEELGDEEEIAPETDDELGDKEDLDAEEPEFGEEDELDDEEDLGDDDDEFDFEDDDDFGEEDELDDDKDELGDEEDEEDIDLGDEEGDEFEEEPEEGDFEGDEDFEDEDEFGDEGEEDPEIELDENIVKKFRKLVRESINEMFGDDFKSSVAKPYGMSDEEYFNADDEDEEDDFDDEGYDDGGHYDKRFDKRNPMDEAKSAKMNSIVESIVNDILNEDELHVFGDHPGYRKKPMTLPQTGEDKFQVNRDWNDESVHSEEPFGKGKGDSTPFDQLVAQITDSVMKQINENKKKVK
jgi:hypothetical protein